MDSGVNGQYQRQTFKHTSIIVNQLRVLFKAVIRFFHIRVGHNFDSNFLEDKEDKTKLEIVKSYTVNDLITTDETEDNYTPQANGFKWRSVYPDRHKQSDREGNNIYGDHDR